MKWLLVVVALIAAVSIGASALGRDETCPGAMTVAMAGLTGEHTVGASTATEALAQHLDGAHEIVADNSSAKGFETVTYRGYSAEGDLVGRVVVERTARGWMIGPVETCDR